MSTADERLTLIRERRSVRAFKADAVPRDLLLKLIDLARWAPSAGNRQDWFFTVVSAPEVKAAMAEAVRARWAAIVAANKGSVIADDAAAYSARFADFERAPVVVVVSARRVDSLQRHMLGEDALMTAGSVASAAMAAQNLMLAAHALGLGSCCMTGALAARAELGAIIGLSPKQEIVCLIALGWPAESPQAPARRPVEQVARSLG